MKFKNVQIQAFRAYDRIEDGTFDFLTPQQNIANFVSIYAPNGFGKTSFYDAVEWGVTKNIHRFLKKDSYLGFSRQEKNFNAEMNQSVLRNQNSAMDRSSLVKLVTTDPNITGFQLEKPRKNQHDYKFNKDETVREYFQEVVLSQEWIDSFLKEDDPTERYATFMTYFGDKEIDGYYKNLTLLINKVLDKNELIEKELKGIQLDLQFSGDTGILTFTNDTISALRIKGLVIDDIAVTVSESDILNTKQKVSALRVGIESAQSKCESIMKNVESALAGSEEVVGIVEFYKNQYEESSLNQEKERLLGLLEIFNSISRQNNELKLITDSKLLKSAELREVQENETFGSEFMRLNEKLAENDAKGFEIYQALAKLEESNEKATSTLSATQAALSLISEALNGIAGEIADLESGRTENSRLLTERKELFDKIIELKSRQETNSKNLFANREELAALQDAILTVENYDFLLSSNITEQFPELSTQLQTEYRESKKLEDQLSQVNLTLVGQEEFNNEINQLVTVGLDIANRLKGSECPLCSHDHSSFEGLVEKIKSNNLLSLQIQSSLNNRQKLSELLGNSEEKLTQIKTLFIGAIKNSENRKRELISSISDEIEIIVKELRTNEAELTRIDEKISQFSNKTGNEPLDVYLEKLNSKRLENEKERVNLEAIQPDHEKATTDIRKNIEHQRLILEELGKDSEQLRNNPGYMKFLEYTNIKFPGQVLGLHLLVSLRESLFQDLEKLTKSEENLKGYIETATANVKDQDEFQIKELVAEIDLKSKKLRMQNQLYRQRILSTLSIDVEGLDHGELITTLEKIRVDAKKDIDSYLATIDQLTLLSRQIEEVQPFLRFEHSKRTFDEKKSELQFNRTRLLSKLETERKRVIARLEEEINSFFYEDMINLLYSKIDPHPDYKRIKFKCDFSEDKPQLNVFVTRDDSDFLLMPNLYFSTAQLNILSLSIFLAKAIHAKDSNGENVQCIFIDDPIQSMDSINILSTIDLLRSISKNLDKQIILSTHDENFFGLLQKKIPEVIFESKFIELETFGKVKTS